MLLTMPVPPLCRSSLVQKESMTSWGACVPHLLSCRHTVLAACLLWTSRAAHVWWAHRNAKLTGIPKAVSDRVERHSGHIACVSSAHVDAPLSHQAWLTKHTSKIKLRTSRQWQESIKPSMRLSECGALRDCTDPRPRSWPWWDFRQYVGWVGYMGGNSPG